MWILETISRSLDLCLLRSSCARGEQELSASGSYLMWDTLPSAL